MVWIQELCATISKQQLKDSDLSPLVHVDLPASVRDMKRYQNMADQGVAELAELLVDEVQSLRANLLEGHDDATQHEL